MKKLLLCSVLGALAFDASAQLVANKSIAELSSNQNHQVTVTPQMDNAGLGKAKSTAKSTAKTTALRTRTYAFEDYLASYSGPLSVGPAPYLWHDGKGKGIYSDPSSVSGVVADTISMASYGVTFDPAFAGFNDEDLYDNKDFLWITRADNYTVDSVIIYGIYGRNTAKTTVVDTLRVAVVHGNGSAGSDLPIYYFTGMTSRFKTDTVRFAGLKYGEIDTFRTYGTTQQVINFPLTATSIYDTAAGGYNRFAIPLSAFDVPAGNIVGASITFKTGDADYTPYVDTVFVGSLDAANPYRFGMFRPLIGEEKAGKFNTYFPNAYNTGFIEFLPQRSGWGGMYLPSYAFTSDSFTLEIPVVNFVVTAEGVSVKEDTKLVSGVTAYPNPANTAVNIRFTAAQSANTNIVITNMMGQVIDTKRLGVQIAGQTVTTEVNTAALPSGIYFYTIEANGQRATASRFTVTH